MRDLPSIKLLSSLRDYPSNVITSTTSVSKKEITQEISWEITRDITREKFDTREITRNYSGYFGRLLRRLLALRAVNRRICVSQVTGPDHLAELLGRCWSSLIFHSGDARLTS